MIELVLKFLDTTRGPTSGDSGGDGPISGAVPPRPLREEGRKVLMLIELPLWWPWPDMGEAAEA